jgi:hypothetical protein
MGATDSANSTSTDPTTPTDTPANQFQMPGFWQSLIDHKLGIDELAPLKAQLLDTQIKEQQMKNARFGVDAQHQDAIFGLTQAEMQAKNLSSELANTITKSTMANRIEESNLNLSELQGKVAGTDAGSIEQKSRAKYYDTLSQEQQLNMAKSLGEASAGTQIGPGDVDALTKNFIDNAGIDPSQKGMATIIYSKAIGGALAQKQQQLGALKQSNDMVAQQKKMDDIAKLLNLASNSTDPEATVEGAAKFLGMDAETINFAKQAAGSMKQPMVTPREDSRTKLLNERIDAAQSGMQSTLEKAGVTSPDQLKPGPRKIYDVKEAGYKSLQDSLDQYQAEISSRQVSRKGIPGQNKKEGKTIADLPGDIVNMTDEDLTAAAPVWGFTLSQLKAERSKRQKGTK